jgi:alpha-tubulin suppressor-like RCC1 family protein
MRPCISCVLWILLAQPCVGRLSTVGEAIARLGDKAFGDGDLDWFTVPGLSTGGLHNCLLYVAGVVRCWGWDGLGQTSQVPRMVKAFASVSAGWTHTCGVDHSGKAFCWGDNRHGETDAPEDVAFYAVSAGQFYTCGVARSGGVHCWGGLPEDATNEHGANKVRQAAKSAAPSGVLFSSVDAGIEHTCGIARNGSCLCWGSNSAGQSAPPRHVHNFATVSTGYEHACGVAMDGRVHCWGSNTHGQSSPQASRRFISVSTGRYHTCGIEQVGSRLHCWGAGAGTRGGGASGDDHAAAELLRPPEAERQEAMAIVSASVRHSCALSRAGSVFCWGLSSVPPGGVTSVPHWASFGVMFKPQDVPKETRSPRRDRERRRAGVIHVLSLSVPLLLPALILLALVAAPTVALSRPRRAALIV